MFAAVDESLARLYPTRRWTERDEAAAFGAGVTAGEGAALARALASRLKALAIHRPGTAEETCDYVYVLCLGRTPSLVAVLAEHDVRHLDFGEILTAPEGFDPADYAERYGGAPAIANYLFFPQPASTVTTVVVT
jgi:hypothetical protein